MLKFNEDFLKNYYENSDGGYTVEVDVKYPKRLHKLHFDLPFLPERMKINKCNKLVCNMYHKRNYVVYIRSLKQPSDHEIILKKVPKVIQFNQKAWYEY